MQKTAFYKLLDINMLHNAPHQAVQAALRRAPLRSLRSHR